MIQLVAFLGNYGKEYENSRHNTAWLFEKSLVFSGNLMWQNKFKSDFCAVDFDVLVKWLVEKGLVKTHQDGSPAVPKNAPQKIYFVKPLTYMNLSGDAVGEVCRFYKIPASDVLIIHDEIELPLGTVSLKWSGGLGGHNGLRSMKAVLGTADFWRLRFGVGKPTSGDIADYVLGNFLPDERIILSQVFPQTGMLLSNILMSVDPQKLIASWSKKKLLAE